MKNWIKATAIAVAISIVIAIFGVVNILPYLFLTIMVATGFMGLVCLVKEFLDDKDNRSEDDE